MILKRASCELRSVDSDAKNSMMEASDCSRSCGFMGGVDGSVGVRKGARRPSMYWVRVEIACDLALGEAERERSWKVWDRHLLNSWGGAGKS